MALYKLLENGVLKGNLSIPPDPANADWQEYQAWLLAGNTPDPADVPTAEQVARDEEVRQAPLTAKEYFLSHPAAIAFIRLTPAEQEATVNGYTLAQLKTAFAHLTVAVSALVKREFLD